MEDIILIGAGAIVGLVALDAAMRKYGAKYRGGGGKVQADETWELLSDMLPRPFMFNVDTHIMYRALSRTIITEKPVNKMMVKMEPVLTEPTSVPEIIEPLFRSDFNPPRCAAPLSIFSNDQSMWYFSEVGPVSDEQMSMSVIEDLRRQLSLKDEQLAQEQAERDAKLKDTVGLLNKLQRQPQPTLRVDDGR